MDKRKLIFTSLIVLALVVAALSITYALNVSVTEGTSSEYDLSYTFDISDNATWTINVEAGKTKVYDISVTNPYSDTIKYGIIYKLDNPTSMPKNSTVAVINTTQNPSQGNVAANSTKDISVAIVNNSDSNMQVTLGIVNGYKNGGSLIIPTGYKIISKTISLPYEIPSETLEEVSGTQSSTTNFLSSTIQRKSIESIEVVKKSEVPSGVSSPVDVSYDKTNNPNQVQLYSILDSSTSKYKVYLATESGKVSLPENSSYLFYCLYGIKTLNLTNMYTNNVTNMSYMLSINFPVEVKIIGLENLDTSNVTNMKGMFDVTIFDTTTLDLSNFDTSNVTDMSRMFYMSSKLKSINLSSFDTSKVTDMSAMFSQTSLKTIYVSESFVTTNVTDSSDMFYGCTNLVGGNGTKFSSSNTDKGYAQIDTSDTTGYFTDVTYKKIEANSPDLVQGLIPVVYNGSKWVKADTTATTSHATCNMLGDVNGDGAINTLDVTRAQRFIGGTSTPTAEQFLCADLNADGVITTEDLQLILSGVGTKVAAGTIGESVSGDVMGTNQWYDYNLKKWANAVLVTSTNRSTYQSAASGTEITESDILAFYVWIPRFKYKVWNISKQAGAESTYAYNAYTEGIDIQFEEEKSSTGTIKCTYNFNVDTSNGGIDLSTTTAETCTGSNGDYYTHPAFTFGTDELRGFWVSKFMMSSSNPTATNGGGSDTSLTVRSLPNVNFWGGINPNSINTVIQNMQISNNIYGLSTSRTNTDSHMIKNMEWGAVAYLTNSKYGRCTDGTCIEITPNNCSTYLTGIGGDTISASSSSTTCTTDVNKYNGAKGMLASTTGNISGVYDMSNTSAYQYIIGDISESSSSFTFNGISSIDQKYLDAYAYDSGNSTNQTAYNRGKLGDATSEIVLSPGSSGGWYGDESLFPITFLAMFKRGSKGLFSFNTDGPIANGGISSRMSLVSLSS